MKGRSLGERPAFRMSPPGCGVSKPGVCGKGLRDAAWEGRWRALGISGVRRAGRCRRGKFLLNQCR